MRSYERKSLGHHPVTLPEQCEWIDIAKKVHGRIIHWIALNTPDSRDITEVNVDAIAGDVVNMEHEKEK